MSRRSRRYIGLATGPILFLTILLIHPFEELNPGANATMAVTAWMAIWWIGELTHISVTALLPIVLLPISGAASINQTTAAYGDKMLFLFVGGFIIAIAMEKWDLHRRIALNIIKAVGSGPDKILLGFMISTGLLSMWISNTATTLMMVTIGSAIIAQTSTKAGSEGEGFFKSLLLGIAYSASIGGVATLVGTPTNPIFVAIANEMYDVDISFAEWMIFAMPFSIVVIFLTWLYLSRVAYKVRSIDLHMGKEIVDKELEALGKMKFEEKAVAWVFGLTAFAWISRTFILNLFIPNLNDTTIAIAGAISLFLIPSNKKKVGLITWDEAVRLPWGVILLFGGGLSLAAAFKSTGLALWIGSQMTSLEALPLLAIILIVTIIVNFMTEVTSNVATASIILPVLAALSQAIGIHPFLLMIPATMAASCAFMLPVATAPNAIVFASGKLHIADMARAGFLLNVLSSTLIGLLAYFFLGEVFDL